MITLVTSLSAQDFKKILRQNGFVDKDSIVRIVAGSGVGSREFEVITKRCMNIGNLINIEKHYGLALYFVEPYGNGQIRVIFGKVITRR
jgi:hypothetical protein